MKISDIIALTNAGWTKDEICRIAGIEKPAPAPAPAPAPEPAPAPAENQESETIQLLKQLTGMIQNNNINNINQPPQNPQDPAELLAQILDP